MADCPQIAGLIVLQNHASALITRALGLIALGARRIGVTLLKNIVGTSARRRAQIYAAARKPIFYLDTINCSTVVDLVKKENIDLLINARTRFIYRDPILTAPRLGCINVHHGLLPEQRGTMCDLWALADGQPAGFTIHRMTKRVDDGAIVRRVQLSNGEERDYMAYLRQAAQREAIELRSLLDEIAHTGGINTSDNSSTMPVVMRHDPTPQQLRAMQKAGLRL